jgi:diguanylate cyclase (GGDEF)-like protein
MFDKVDKYLKSVPRPVIFFISVLIVVILGYIDHLIAPRVSLSIFYTVPVAGSAWYLNRKAGFFMSFWAAVIWLAADVTANHQYVHFFIPFWNSMVRLVFFIIIAHLLSVIKTKLDMEESLADTDYLTGLKNSRSFYEHLEAESGRSKRSSKPFTIVYIDLDNFKYVNDTLGHDTGDDLIRAVADTLRNYARQSDVISRMGGDEFAGLFPETDFDNASTVISNTVGRLHKTMEDNNWPVTFSIGAITFSEPMKSVRDMVKAVDNAMYEVKRTSKNNIVHRNV